MIKCINTSLLLQATSFDALLREAAGAGFAGLELDFGAEKPLWPERFGQTGPSAQEKAQDWGLKICSVTTGKYDIFSLGASGAQIRDAADEYFNNLIDLAAEVGRGVGVVIGAHETKPLGAKTAGAYERRFNLVFESLEKLAGAAKKHSVRLAAENPGSGLLLSPLELRELIDQINNPYLGVCLNPGYVEQVGDPLDWLDILDRRIIMVRLPVEPAQYVEAEEKYQSLLNELSKRNFTGPIVYTKL